MAAHILNDHIVVNCTSSEIDPRNECIHFLTHIGRHQKSLSGIISSHIKKVYTSEFNVWYLRTFFDANISQFVGVPLWTKRQVKTKNNTFTFEFFNANHCPGAVMILMKGDFGSYLYTGNCRHNPAMLDYTSLKPYSQGIKILDKLYVNAAYLKMEHNFPKRELVIQQVLDFISDHSDEKIYMCTRLLGKEDILFRIVLELNEKIYVNPDKLKILNKLGYKSSLFTTEMCLARLRVVDVSEITGVKMKRRRLTEKCIGIIFSACNTNEEKLKKHGIYIFPASDHSSANETKLMMKAFKATNVYLLNSDSTLSIHIQNQKNCNPTPLNPPIINSPIVDSFKNETNLFSNKKKLSLKLNSPRVENQPLSAYKFGFKMSSKSTTADRKVNKQRQLSFKNNKSVSKVLIKNLNEKQSTEPQPSEDHSDDIIECSDNAKVVENSFFCDDNARSGFCSSGDQNHRRNQLSPSFPPSVSNIILTDLSHSSGSIEHYSERNSLSSSELTADNMGAEKPSDRNETNGDQKKATNFKKSSRENLSVSDNKSLSPEYPPSVSSIKSMHSSTHSRNVKNAKENDDVSPEYPSSGSSIDLIHSSTHSGNVKNAKENDDVSPEYPSSGSSIGLIYSSTHSGNVKNTKENYDVSPEYPPSVSSIDSIHSSTRSGNVKNTKENYDVSPEYPPSVSSIDSIHSSIHSGNVKNSKENNDVSPEYPLSVSSIDSIHSSTHRGNVKNTKRNNDVSPEYPSSGSSIDLIHSTIHSGNVKNGKENNDVSPEYPPSVSIIDSIHSSTHSRNTKNLKENNDVSPECPSSGSSIDLIHSSTHSGNVKNAKENNDISPEYPPSVSNNNSTNLSTNRDNFKASNGHPSVSDNNKVSPEYPSSISSIASIHSSHRTSNKNPCELPCVSNNNDVSPEYPSIINSIQSSSNGVSVQNNSGAFENKDLSPEYPSSIASINSNHSTIQSRKIDNLNVQPDVFNNKVPHSAFSIDTNHIYSHSESNTVSSRSVSTDAFSNQTSAKIQVHETLENSQNYKSHSQNSSQLSSSPVNLFSPSFPPSASNIKLGRLSDKTPFSSRHSGEDVSCISATETIPGLCQINGGQISSISLAKKVPTMSFRPSYQNQSKSIDRISSNMRHHVSQSSVSSSEREEDVSIIPGTVTDSQDSDTFGKRKSTFTLRLEVISESPACSQQQEAHSQIKFVEESNENESIHCGLVSMNLTKVVNQGSESQVVLMDSTCHNQTDIHDIVKNSLEEPITKSVHEKLVISSSVLNSNSQITETVNESNHQATTKCRVGNSSIFISDIHQNKLTSDKSLFKIDKIKQSHPGNETYLVKNKSMRKSSMSLTTLNDKDLTISPLRTVEESRINTLFSADVQESNRRQSENCVELTLCNDVLKSKNTSDFENKTQEALMDETTVLYTNHEVVCEVYPRPRAVKQPSRTKTPDIYEQTTLLLPQNCSSQKLDDSESHNHSDHNIGVEQGNVKMSVFETQHGTDKLLDISQKEMFQSNPSDCGRGDEKLVNIQVNYQKEIFQSHQSSDSSKQIEIVTKTNSEVSESEKVTTNIQASINSSESLCSLENKESIRSKRNKRRKKKQSATTQCPVSQSSTATQKFTSLPLLRSSLSSFSNSSVSFDRSQRTKPIQSKHFKSLHSESTLPPDETLQDDQTENTPPNLDESKSTQLIVESTQNHSVQILKDVRNNSSNLTLQNKKSNLDMFSSDVSTNVSTQSSLTMSVVNTQDQRSLSQCSNNKALPQIVNIQDQKALLQSNNNKKNTTVHRSQLKPPINFNIRNLNLSQPLTRKPFTASLPLSQPPLTGSYSINLRSRLPTRYPNIKPI